MDAIKELLEKSLRNARAEKREEDGLGYFRFKKKAGQVPRGTVVTFTGRVIWGYPKIKRIFTLEKGLGRNISGEAVYAEEKIDGFNVRIARIGKEFFAFSRSGLLDAFATEKARGMELDRFFSANPGVVLCGEMTGNTPHTGPVKHYDVKFFVFDIDQGDGGYMPPDDRYKLLERFGIESVPRLGKFSKKGKALARLALSLNKGGKEGMVLKDGHGNEKVKYVNPKAGIADMAECSARMFDMPSGFFHQRLLRTAIYLKEFGLDREKYGEMIGNALLSGLVKGLGQAEKTGGVSDEFEVLVRNPDTWEGILRHMGKEVRIEVIWKRREKDGTRIRFRKFYLKSGRTYHDFLGGKAIED